MKWKTWQRISIIDGIVIIGGGIGMLICAILQSQSSNIQYMATCFCYVVICFGLVLGGICFLLAWQGFNPYGI